MEALVKHLVRHFNNATFTAVVRRFMLVSRALYISLAIVTRDCSRPLNHLGEQFRLASFSVLLVHLL